MGTVVVLQLEVGELAATTVREAVTGAVSLLHRHDRTFSTWKRDSPMSKVRRGELRLDRAPAEIAEVLDRCSEARRLTRGWFDPFALPGGVDPTGLVKGWAAEQVLVLLRDSGVRSAMVNAGGDIACFRPPGEGAWRIGVRHPWRTDAFAAVLEVDASIATSGEYERGRHLIDPIGLRGPRPASATVTGPSLALADAFATAVAVGGARAMEAVAAVEGYEVYVVGADGVEQSTAGIRFVASTCPPAPAPTTANGAVSLCPAPITMTSS